MRFLAVALLLDGPLAVPPAAATAPCSDQTTDVGCWLAYAQDRADHAYGTAMGAYDDVEQAWEDLWGSLPPCIREPFRPECWT